MGVKEIGSYPDHKKYTEIMRKIWDDNPDIDNWIIKAYDYLISEKKELNHNV